MQSRESVRHLLLDAINRKNKVHVEQLLYQGAGMFMDLPRLFLELDVNASHCYVQGLTIEGERATRATRGFHQAFFSVEEMRLCKLKQDSLMPDATRRMIPLMSLHAAFDRYKNDPTRDGNPEFIAAENEFKKLSVLPSLQKMALQTLLNEDNSFEQVNPDHENVIILLESRVAELFALRSYINEVAADAERSNELEQIEVLLLNIFSICTGSTALLFFGYSMVILMSAICCGCPGPFQASLLFFGIPGSIVALLAVVTLILLINRLRQHGCDGLNPVMQYSIRNNPTLASILDKLIAIMSSENLPEDIQEIMDELKNPAIGFERAINHLSVLIQYYTYKEMYPLN